MHSRLGHSRGPGRGITDTVRALVLLTVWLALGSSPAEADVNAGGLRLERPTGKVAIDFAPSVQGTREGTFTLLLRNMASIALRPRLTLDPAGNEAVLYLHLLKSSSGGSSWLRSIGKVPRIPPRGVGRIALVVGLPATSNPNVVNGTLVMRAVNSSLVPHGKAALIPITAAGLDLPGVQAVPDAVTLHTTAWLPGGHAASGTEAELELRGLDASTLIEAGHLDGRGLLRSAEGKTIAVRIEAKREDGEMRPMIQVAEHAAAGTYTGTIPLSRSSQAPMLSVSVTARDAIVWALAAVALGAFLGGLLPLLGKRARMRNVLRARLQGALLKYFSAKSADSTMKWLSLDDAIGTDRVPWTSTEWQAVPSLSGAAGLFSELHWAQSEDELNKLGKQIEDLMERITLWLTLQPKVVALTDAERKPVEAIDGHAWPRTTTAVNSRRLGIEVAGGEPDVAKAAATSFALETQREWHSEVAKVWLRLLGAWDDLKDPGRGELLDRLEKITAPPVPTPGARGVDDWTALSLKLDDLLTEFNDAWIEQASGVASGAQNIEHPSETPLDGSTTTPAEFGHTLATWMRNLLPRIRTRLVRLVVRGQPARLMAAARRQDLMLSIIAALGAMLVYVLQIYTATWGSLTDYLSAVAAGFGAQVVVRWAALPIFESWRWRQ